MTIPITKPFLGDEEIQAAGDVIRSGWVTQGPKVKEFENAFSAYTGSRHSCCVSSCTAGLHLALLAVGVKPGNCVLTVSHSFIATANSVRYCSAEPVFIDIDYDTFNMSAEALSDFLSQRCKIDGARVQFSDYKSLSGLNDAFMLDEEAGRVAAILVVHQMGMPADLSHILALAKKYGLPVIEDAACAIGSEISFDDGTTFERIGKPHGDCAVFSFHPRKVITTGEGGMITSADVSVDAHLRLLRHHGMSVSDVARHESKTVIFEEYPVVGFNYRMTDIQAAIGCEQLKKIDVIIARRREIAARYQKELGEVAWLRVQREPPYARTNWQSFPVRVLDTAPASRDEIMQQLLDAGIASRPGIMNAHDQDIYSNELFDLPESERAQREVILLPLFPQMSDEEITTVIQRVKDA